MPDRNVIHELNSEQVDLARTGVSDASDVATISVAGDTLSPAAPVLNSADSVPDGVKLDITTSSLNEDGTTCVDLKWLKIYWGSATGVYTGEAVMAAPQAGTDTVYIDTNIGALTEKYYVVSAIDSSGNESAVSNEEMGTGGGVSPTTDIPTDADGHVFDDTFGDDAQGVKVGYGMIGIVFKIPNPSWGNFDRYRLFFDENNGTGFPDTWAEIKPINRTAFIHKGLNVTNYYKYRASIVAKDGTESDTTSPYLNFDYAIGAGSGYLPNVATEGIFDDTILAENVVAVNEVRGEHFYAASFLSINNTLFGSEGIQLQYNGGNPQAYIGNGHATPSLERFFMFEDGNISWQGENSSLTAAGKFTATDAVISGAITSSSIASSTINIGSNFSVDASGNMSCSNATISGTLDADDITTGTLSVTRLADDSVTWGKMGPYDTTNGLDTENKGIYNCSQVWSDDAGSIKRLTLIGGTFSELVGYHADCSVSLGSTLTTLSGGTDGVTISGTGGSIYLNSADEIWFTVDGGTTIAKCNEIVATDSITLDIGHEGYMKFDVGGVVRYVAFRTS